jgi:hypothetical protein
MIDNMTNLAVKLTGFIKSRVGLSMMLALQIFILKTTRTKGLVITGTVLLVVGHIIGMHLGVCPLKEAKLCQLFLMK